MKNKDVLLEMLCSKKTIQELEAEELYSLYKNNDITIQIFRAVEEEILNRVTQKEEL